MENENVESNTPVTETEVADEDFFADVDEDVIENGVEESDNSNETEESSQPNETEGKEEEDDKVDYAPLLEALSKKVKYNGESVKVDSIDDLITNFQKGLNYDKKNEQYEALQNSKVEQYVSKKAKELGLTVDEYIEQVEEYEKEQEKAREEERLEEMISNGVPEDVAREVIATSQLRKQLQAKENELKEREEAQNAKHKEEQEYADFIAAFPDVKAEDIPKEVYEAAQGSNLTSAYKDWLIKDLQTKLSIQQTNSKNAQSAIGSVTESGPTKKNEPVDLFLEGFDSD